MSRWDREEKERVGGGVGGGGGRTCGENLRKRVKKCLYLLLNCGAAEYRWGRLSFYIFGTARDASRLFRDLNTPSSNSIWQEVSAPKKKKKNFRKHFNRLFQTCRCKLMMRPLSFLFLLFMPKLKIQRQPVFSCRLTKLCGHNPG